MDLKLVIVSLSDCCKYRAGSCRRLYLFNAETTSSVKYHGNVVLIESRKLVSFLRLNPVHSAYMYTNLGKFSQENSNAQFIISRSHYLSSNSKWIKSLISDSSNVFEGNEKQNFRYIFELCNNQENCVFIRFVRFKGDCSSLHAFRC